MSEAAETPTEAIPDAGGVIPATEEVLSEAELRARRTLVAGLVMFALVLVALIVLLVLLSINAYRATMTGAGPDPGAVVVSLLRDAAIIMVAFETLIIGALLVVLTLQVQALVRLLRDEIQPMLAALNDTVATVRGTTQFVSHNVVEPTIRAASFLAGLRRVLREAVDLGRGSKRE
jgi:hypothetical protein